MCAASGHLDVLLRLNFVVGGNEAEDMIAVVHRWPQQLIVKRASKQEQKVTSHRS